MRTFLVATYLQEEIPNFVIIKNLSETQNEKNKKKKKNGKNWPIILYSRYQRTG